MNAKEILSIIYWYFQENFTFDGSAEINRNTAIDIMGKLNDYSHIGNVSPNIAIAIIQDYIDWLAYDNEGGIKRAAARVILDRINERKNENTSAQFNLPTGVMLSWVDVPYTEDRSYPKG